MSKDKMTVYQIDFEYRTYLKKICREALGFYRGIPLTWEDIYNNFLYEAPGYLEEYDEDSQITKKTFLGIKCKYFAFNYCKGFQTNKHKIMNDSISISDERKMSLRDPSQVTLGVDLSNFTEDEINVYQSHYLDGKSYGEIQKEFHMTRYKVKALIKIIQAKMLSKLKN